uniref:ANK_REP_REGION domain-containing protein n=1 Tax=Heterorhabditis bacteriophora TaxID=37862 RepID=A0A1I7X759_HETBA
MNGMEFRAVVFNAARDGNLRRLKVFLDGRRSKSWLNSCLNSDENDKLPLVIAARNNHLDIVQYLLSKGADPHAKGTVTFDGETIYGSPALWAAAAAGNMEIVRVLVEDAGADINQTTNTSSTPLRGACYDGHLHIGNINGIVVAIVLSSFIIVSVKYLVEHGADVEIANQHGHTPLMIASYRRKISVVQYLIEKGADVSRSSKKGNTALHDAAEGESADICRLLLRSGARLHPDDQGLCPLMCSAMIGNEKVVPILLEHCESGRLRRDALKILGCTRVDKKMDHIGGCQAWAQAVEIPLTEQEQREVDEVAETYQVANVYEGNRELQTKEDVLELDGCPDAIRMQSLLIRERILGGGHTEVHYYLRFRGAIYCDLGRVDKCYELWMHALNLQQMHLSPLHLSTQTTLQAFLDTFLHLLNGNINHFDHGRRNHPMKGEIVVAVFEKLCYELERVCILIIVIKFIKYGTWFYYVFQLALWGDKPLFDLCNCGEDHVYNSELEKQKLVLVGLQLLLLVMPAYYVIERLLMAGALVDVKDPCGDTPLHVLLKNSHTRPSLVRLLLEYGAPLLARDTNNATCIELLQKMPPLAIKNLRLGKYLTLSGLAANAVRRYSIPLDGVVPIDMLRFIDLH